MYTEFKNVKNIMKFLKEHTYSHVKKDIWDCNLWFYGKVENLNNKMFYTDKLKNIKLYKFENRDNDITGVAVVSHNKFCISVYVDLLENVDLNDFVNELLKENNTIILNCCRKNIADYVIGNFKGILKESLSMYYCFKETLIKNGEHKITELTQNDEKYFKYNWHQMKALMDQGIRYYSIIENNEIRSLAGLAPFSATRAEIVCVKTDERYRNQGLSKALCSHVISEGFKEYPVITWTTHCNNKKSIALTKALGFNSLITTHQIIINKNNLI